ncbi:MAG: DUF2804 domain-containing protein [Spirochaetaceae bacterium]|jgi:hypothetical protein|nr:DUF2804 domain-containing protein [Spirochaetaceae bacterium]
MYTREIQPPRGEPLEQGLPLQGTWTAPFDEVDLLRVRKPFSLPLPGWMKDCRIKEWEIFIVQDERFFLEAILCNLKYFRWAQVLLYDGQRKEKLRFRKLIPFGLGVWRMPRNLANASIDSRSYGFFFRIHPWLDADIIKVDIDIEAARKRPPFTAHLEYEADRSGITPMAVNLLFTETRCMYAYKAVMPVRGDMVFAGQHIALNPEKTTGFFGDFKGYYPYQMHGVWCTGLGFDSQNRRYGFSIAENQTKETFKNNENALWVEGALTPLPPVRITMPQGFESDWVIQDMEGMVDLVFTPQTQIVSRLPLWVIQAEYTTPIGLYNGTLLDAAGKPVEIRNHRGFGECLKLRL